MSVNSLYNTVDSDEDNDEQDEEESIVRTINLPWKQLSNAEDIARILRVATGPIQINLIGNDLADKGTEILTKELTNNYVQDLNLSCNHISYRGACAISHYMRTNLQLKHLCLFGNDICDSGCAEIAKALRYNPALETLNLSYNNIGSDGAIALGLAIREHSDSSGISKIDLTGNSIGDEGACVLAESLPQNGSINDLTLSRNSVSDVGAIAFANALRMNCRLQGLRMADNEIGATGAKALAASLKHNTHLRIIDLRFNDTMGYMSGYLFLSTVQECNTNLTVCDVSHSKSQPLQRRIDYWCELNQWGRSMAQFEEGASLLPLILEHCKERPDLIFGLLSETPHIWSKRK